MSDLSKVFEAHKKKRASYAPPASSAPKARTTTKKSTKGRKGGWKKSSQTPDMNSKRDVSNTPLDDLNILILDTAADSLNPLQANLFQVSMLVGNFNSGHWRENAYRVESVDMPAHFILSLEGEDDLFPDKRVVALDEVMSNIVEAFHKADLVIAYSSAYHLQLLACEAKRAGYELPPIHVLDPFAVYSTAYKYSRGKKLTDAIEKFGSKIADFGTAGFYSRTPLAIKWLVEQMIQDENCAKFFDTDSLADLTREQVIASAMNFIDLKEFFSKQSNGRTVTWRAWPTAPDGSNKVPEGLSEVVSEFEAEFITEPEVRPEFSAVSFAYFASNPVFQSLAIGLLSTEETAEPTKAGDCFITSYLENDNLTCILVGKTADSMYSVLSEINKFPLTSLGVEEQTFNPVETVNEDDGTLIMKLVLCQK